MLDIVSSVSRLKLDIVSSLKLIIVSTLKHIKSQAYRGPELSSATTKWQIPHPVLKTVRLGPSLPGKARERPLVGPGVCGGGAVPIGQGKPWIKQQF